jgi:hypothetical protein
MTNSKSENDAIRIIEEVFELIDEDYIGQFIEKRIDKAAADFKFDREAPITHKNFIRIIGDFVCQIYKNGVLPRQTLSVTQARIEAMAILSECYGSPIDSAYDAAYLSLQNSKMDGYEFILIQMLEAVKAMARERHIKWVYASRIIPLDWHTRCQIAEILLNRWRSFLPPDIRQCTPPQFADHLPGLFNLLRTIDCTVRNMLNADFEFVASETR